MKNNRISLIATVILLAPACIPEKATKPNIIVILADDMGFSDLGCTGSEIETPNLDLMAQNGLLFTNFYNTSRCCPSRASLLTGQYQWDAGVGHQDSPRGNLPEYQGYLNKKVITIAEALKQGGYQTFMSGKWHLGNERHMWPDYRGFDQTYVSPHGGGLYFYPSKYYDRPVFWNGKEVFPDSTWYSTDGFTDYTIDYIKKRREKDQPFFIYLAYIAPHFPLQAKQQDIDKYINTYKVGYDSIRMNRFRKQIELELFPDTSTIPAPEYPDWDEISDKETEAYMMAVYAAMVDCMDQNIGRIMTALEQEGIKDNTMVIFLSDNGACNAKFNQTPDVKIGTHYSNAAYGDWYNVSNTPYRKYKAMGLEGGIITPMIVHWPDGIKNTGNYIRTPAHIMDFMPTFLEIAGVDYPSHYNGIELDSLDGESFYHLLNGNESIAANRSLFWEHEGNRAVRQGNWKLVAAHSEEWELYNLSQDPFEKENLVSVYPEIANKMLNSYKAWAKKHKVAKWPLYKQMF